MPNIMLSQPLPAPRCEIAVRPATAGGAGADLGFIDQLQKMHSHMVGFLPLKQIEKKIADGDVLVAEEVGANQRDVVPIGYIISKDQYLKRDDVGIVYQLNVAPLRQRHLVGAMLVKSAFERAAYGCRLFSCWCAQDIQANWFWESIGFVPLAFRTGSRSKQRIHIFWQKRIREGDEGPQQGGGTPYWFPSKTEGGAVGEDRIVLPIPAGTHWRDAKPLILPGLPTAPPQETPKSLPGGALVKARPDQPRLSKADRAAIMRTESQHLGGPRMGRKAVIRGGRIQYVEREDFVPELDAPETMPEAKKQRKPRAPRQKHDQKFVIAARELRDRFLDQLNAGLILPGSECQAKYEVRRLLPEAAMDAQAQQSQRLLDAA